MKKPIIPGLVLILLLAGAFAISDKERSDMIEYLDNVQGKQQFEIFLAFADAKEYDFSNENAISGLVEQQAKSFGVLLAPYEDIQGIQKERIDAEIGARQPAAPASKPLKLSTFWTITLILVAFAIIIVALEYYRKEKVKGARRRKR